MRHEASFVVHRPIEEVWAFLADFFQVPRYGELILGIRQTSPGRIAVGTSVRVRMAMLGERWIEVTVTEWDRPHTMAISGTGGRGLWSGSGSLRQTLEATADGTKVVRVVELKLPPALKLFGWILGPWLWRKEDDAVQKIKRFLDGGRS